MSEREAQFPLASHAERNEWDADICACGTPVVSCHGCAESRCLKCDPYTEYELINRCCVVVSIGAAVPEETL